MNLQPLYDVKERLESAAIAGTGLLGEDFRLQRAAEALKPLASASPVFAKIDGSLQSLLAAPAEERAGMLLDVLALVDAVAYTQGSTGVQGELAPLPRKGCGACMELSYMQLHPLLEAVNGAGGGRFNLIQEVWSTHPDFFSDYRILPALVEHLDESYAELAELYVEILKRQGSSILPLLKEGFDPAGKREMVRRVEIIAALSGGDAGLWLREILPASKKDVRAAVIIALGRDGENVGLFLDLAKTERGRIREAVLEALAHQDGEAVQSFWIEEAARNPDSVQYLRFSHTGWASDLVAAVFRAQLEGLLTAKGQVSPEALAALNNWRAAVLGKSSPAMLDCWRWIDGQLAALGKVKPASGAHSRLDEELPSWLLDSLCQAGPGPLCGLSLELWNRHRNQELYLPHGLIASLLACPAAEVYKQFSPYLAVRKLDLNSAHKKILRRALQEGLSRLLWNREQGRYEVSFREAIHGYAPVCDCRWPILQPLDPRWYDLLVENPAMIGVLRRLFRPDDPRICAKAGVCLYEDIRSGCSDFMDDPRICTKKGSCIYQATLSDNSPPSLWKKVPQICVNMGGSCVYKSTYGGPFALWQDAALLRECGWTEWKGLLSERVKRDSSLSLYIVARLLDETPLTGPEKAAELRALDEIIRTQKGSRPRWDPQQVQGQLEAWEKEIRSERQTP